MAVAGDLYRGLRQGKRRAASRRKQHDLRARGGQRRGGHQIVAGRGKEVETCGFDSLSIGQHVPDGRKTAFLRTAQGFVLQSADPPALLPGEGFS